MRQHLTYANVMVTILAFVVLGGGTALAAYVVSSNSQIGPDTVSGHKPPSGKHANIIAGSINREDVATSSLETCSPHPLIFKFGRLCEGSDGRARTWEGAANYCRQHGLRLPTLGEAWTLGRYDIDGVAQGEYFWTDDLFPDNTSNLYALVVRKGASPGLLIDARTDSLQTVCVALPTA
jgi:hypothetical protein